MNLSRRTAGSLRLPVLLKGASLNTTLYGEPRATSDKVRSQTLPLEFELLGVKVGTEKFLLLTSL